MLIILPILISSGLSVYYYYEISKPWYVLDNINKIEGVFEESKLLKQEDHLFVATNQNELSIYSMSQNNTVIFKSIVKFNVTLNQKIAIIDNFIFTVENNNFYIYNFTNYTNYGQVGKKNASTYIYDFEINENIAYLATSFELIILNISNPRNMSIISTYTENNHFAYGKHKISYYDEFLYLTDTYRGLRIINVSNPFKPHQVAQYFVNFFSNPESSISEIAVSEKYVILLDRYNGLLIYSRISPDVLEFLGFTYASSSTVKMEIKGNFIYIAEENRGFRLVSIADPNNPYTETVISNNSSCYGFVLVDQDVFVLQENEIGFYQLVLGVGPNPTRKAIAIQVITGFLQVLAYLVLAVVLFILVKRSRILQ